MQTGQEGLTITPGILGRRKRPHGQEGILCPQHRADSRKGGLGEKTDICWATAVGWAM